MTAYLILLVVTLILVMVTIRFVRKTGQWTFAVGMAILYAWTLMGAWFFVSDALSGYMGYRIGLNYYYLMPKMFPFELDACYITSLVRYSAFLLMIVGVVWLIASRRDLNTSPMKTPIYVDHRIFIFLALLGAASSYALVRATLMEAIAEGVSIYQFTRHTEYPGSTIHTLSNLVVCHSLLLGWMMSLTRKNARYLGSKDQYWTAWLYPFALILFSSYLLVLGNRHELFMALILGAGLFIVNGGRLRSRAFALYVVLAFVPMVLADVVRNHTWQEISTQVMLPKVIHPPFEIDIIAHVPRSPEGPMVEIGHKVFSNELFAAHFSMYGICRKKIPIDPFVSVNNLIASGIPRILRSERPPTAYDRYAEGAGVDPDQGYTIHHAAAWYINGGWFGIVLGAVLLGGFWGWLLNAQTRPMQGSLFRRLFGIMGATCFVAFLPAMVRDGPEIYKALIIEGMALPIGVVFLAALSFRWNDHRSPKVNES